MRRPSKATSAEPAFYEGLIFKTASLYVAFVEEDLTT
jgi:hypothetical protein